MIRVWFNHWFSAVYNIISMMREGCIEELYVIGSNKNETAVYKSMCDAWHREPNDCTDAEYVDFCLAFCQKHHVDVFIPRRGLSPIMQNADRFSEIGVKIFGDASSQMITILDDKVASYRFFSQRGFTCIPDVLTAHSLDEFTQACDALSKKHRRICYKLGIDEGARSFRVIDSRIKKAQAILEKPGFKIDYSDAITVLSQYDFSIPVLVIFAVPYSRSGLCLRLLQER